MSEEHEPAHVRDLKAERLARIAAIEKAKAEPVPEPTFELDARELCRLCIGLDRFFVFAIDRHEPDLGAAPFNPNRDRDTLEVRVYVLQKLNGWGTITDEHTENEVLKRAILKLAGEAK